MQQKRVPMRMCTGCNEMKPKKEMIRVVHTPEKTDENGNVILPAEIVLDLTGKKSGRGAYICKSVACLQAARRARRIERAFDCKIPDEIYQSMEEELQNNE